MTALTPGWIATTLGEVSKSVRNGLFKSRPTDDPSDGVRILRISAVRESGMDLTASKFVSGVSPDEVAKYSINAGDLLITRYNGSRKLVGISARVPGHSGPVLHPDKLIRVVLDDSQASSHFVDYQLSSAEVRAFLDPRIRTTAGQSGISGVDVKAVPLVLPNLSEQRRIVELLDDHFSRLDAATQLVATAGRRRTILIRAILERIVPVPAPQDWRMTTVGQAGRLQLGRARHPDWHHGPEMRPYLRVANVFEDRIDTRDVMSMDFSGIFPKYRLHEGDILLNEGQSPHLLGRPAIYRGIPADVAFTNSLIRFQAHDDVLPEWALLVFRRHMHTGRFRRESRITTNIAHLSMTRLRTVEFPVPPLDTQRALISAADVSFGGLQRLHGHIAVAQRRAGSLRRGLLEAAFTGRLTGRSTDIEIAEELAEVGG